MTAPDLVARAKQMERDFRYDADHGNSPRPKALIDAADLIRDLRAEIERECRARVDLWNICIETLNELPRLVDTMALAARAKALRLGYESANADLAALRSRHEELRRDFRRYTTDHLMTCALAKGDLADQFTPCTCGLDAARGIVQARNRWRLSE